MKFYVFCLFPLFVYGKYSCREFSVFQETCETFDFEAVGCEKWNTHNCPEPHVTHNVHCSVYHCEFLVSEEIPQKINFNTNL